MTDLFGRQEAVPARPPAAYLGGKKALARHITARIEQIPHKSYVEPFMGMGGIFFRRRFVAPSEVVNDINGELVNLFRILQRHYPQFMDVLKFQVTSRREFERLAGVDSKTLTDLERAARFLYLQRLAFAGRINGHFAVSPGSSARFDVARLTPQLADVHERLASVTIENLPWAEILDKYDSPETLFYLDPPYWGSETDYGRGVFARTDFSKLAKHLAVIRGNFLLSLNDCEGVRKAFAAFKIQEVTLTYTVAQGGGKTASELVISNS